MSSILIMTIIGLFCWFVAPTFFKGNGKKNSTNRRYCKIIGAVLVLLAVIGLVNHFM